MAIHLARLEVIVTNHLVSSPSPFLLSVCLRTRFPNASLFTQPECLWSVASEEQQRAILTVRRGREEIVHRADSPRRPDHTGETGPV